MTASEVGSRANPGGTITVRKLTGTVGVELSGVDLNAEYGTDVEDALRDALYNNSVLVVRNQFLGHDAHMRLARVFGEPWMPSYYSSNTVEGYPEIAIVPNFGKAKAPAEGWHTDWSHMTKPPTVSVAIPTVLAPAGGDTMFSNQYNAYDRLSDGMREFLAGRRAKFVGTRPKRDDRKVENVADLSDTRAREDVVNFHPIAPVHPHTGRTALYLNRPGDSMMEIEGMSLAESLPILHYLHELSQSPDNVYRHTWAAGDVVCWDNRCAMHYGVHDYGDVERTLERVTVDGAI